ncbi:hypothetical protein PR048_024616 [Dryococelus australis]|uniref:Uncharacterized protein n=1 Tax=Dryococelus australis TaxID=614101 RepID=A0ABQ9GP16_9NEOP|nr:hypothetical protein PR048_024616 [Dryococelus australis]
MWESCRTMLLVGGFHRGAPVFPLHLHPCAAPYLPHFILIGSQISPIHSNHTSCATFTVKLDVSHLHPYRYRDTVFYWSLLSLNATLLVRTTPVFPYWPAANQWSAEFTVFRPNVLSWLEHAQDGFGPIGNQLREAGPITSNQVERENVSSLLQKPTECRTAKSRARSRRDSVSVTRSRRDKRCSVIPSSTAAERKYATQVSKLEGIMPTAISGLQSTVGSSIFSDWLKQVLVRVNSLHTNHERTVSELGNPEWLGQMRKRHQQPMEALVGERRSDVQLASDAIFLACAVRGRGIHGYFASVYHHVLCGITFLIRPESATDFDWNPSQHSSGEIPESHGKPKSGWPDRESNPGPPECESSELPCATSLEGKRGVPPVKNTRAEGEGVESRKGVHSSVASSFNCIANYAKTTEFVFRMHTREKAVQHISPHAVANQAHAQLVCHCLSQYGVCYDVGKPLLWRLYERTITPSKATEVTEAKLRRDNKDTSLRSSLQTNGRVKLGLSLHPADDWATWTSRWGFANLASLAIRRPQQDVPETHTTRNGMEGEGRDGEPAVLPTAPRTRLCRLLAIKSPLQLSAVGIDVTIRRRPRRQPTPATLARPCASSVNHGV